MIPLKICIKYYVYIYIFRNILNPEVLLVDLPGRPSRTPTTPFSTCAWGCPRRTVTETQTPEYLRFIQVLHVSLHVQIWNVGRLYYNDCMYDGTA